MTASVNGNSKEVARDENKVEYYCSRDFLNNVRLNLKRAYSLVTAIEELLLIEYSDQSVINDLSSLAREDMMCILAELDDEIDELEDIAMMEDLI